MFPVVAVPGYFLFVLIRSCILNDIMLIRDSKMNTMSLSGIFFLYGSMELLFDLYPNQNCASFCTPVVVWGSASMWGRNAQKVGTSLSGTEVKKTDGLSCNMRDFSKIRHLVGGLACTLCSCLRKRTSWLQRQLLSHIICKTFSVFMWRVRDWLERARLGYFRERWQIKE